MSQSQGKQVASKIVLRLSYVRLVIAGILLTIACGSVLIPGKNALGLFSDLSTNAQTQSGSANSATASSPPSSLQTSEPNAVASAGRPVLIDFSNLPFYTAVTNQYPDAIFASDSGDYVITTPQNYGTALPNISRAYLYGFWTDGTPPYNHFAPLIVDFPKPVNDLAFHLLAADDIGVIALVDIYQNHVYTKTEPIFGSGNPFSPIWVNLGAAGYKNVTRIVVNGISDRKGLAFDNFSFTVPTATPTPTPSPSPTPTPPPAPTNVKATPDEEEIFVSWTPSQGAGWYVIKRADAPAPTSAPATSNITTPDSNAFAPVEASFHCDSVPCVYQDNNAGAGLNVDTVYSYVVVAVNSVGPGPESNPPASAQPLPPPGCNLPTDHTPIVDFNYTVSKHGWKMDYAVTQNEGLVLRNVSLNGRLMAERISTPYYWLDTQTSGQSGIKVHGELRPDDGPSASPRSRLVSYHINASDPNKLVLEAKYEIDKIPGTPQACLNVSQKYQFYKEGFGGRCEPSGEVSCARFRPMTSYSFHGGQGEHLNSINLPQRHHYKIYGVNEQTAGFFRDADFPGQPLVSLPPTLGIGFSAKDNPLRSEAFFQVIKRGGQNTGVRDNFHQANGSGPITEPGDLTSAPNWRVRLAGCPECLHFHWRWGKFLDFNGRGFPLIPQGSTQSLDVAVMRYRQQEEKPFDYGSLLVPRETLRDSVARPNPNPLFPPIIVGDAGTDMVFWYSPHGFSSSDTFFFESPNPSEGQYAWFNAKNPEIPTSTSLTSSVSGTNTPEDGPISVVFGNVYEAGATTMGVFDLSSLPPLPSGYAPLNNTGYKIDTTGVTSGPDVITFSAASVSDQDAFSKLRVFHVEPDAFDPEKPVWVGRTILAPDTPSPDFSAKTLGARSDELGVFVIGKQIQAPQPETDVANLSVNCVDSADPIIASNNLTYTIRITNNGPQTANEVALVDGLSSEMDFVSAASDQGTCKKIDGTVYCSLNSIPSGATTTISIIVKPTEGVDSFPVEGKSVATNVMVRAKEPDSDASNNSVTETTLVLPSPNKPPSVSITTPSTNALFVGPTNIAINTTATDSDGTISKVEFFDNGELIGVGTPTGSNQYVITKQNASFGDHSLIAVATDNGDRQSISNVANVIVNGAANVSITTPSTGALFSSGSNLTLTANATHPSGIINKVEFFRNGESLGLGTAIGGNQYNIPWNNADDGMYSIVAVATDGSGVTTTSAPVNITVDTAPTVAINTPVNGTVFPSGTNISVSANAQSAHGSITRVDFYANGVLVGSASDVGTDKFTTTWRHLPDDFYTLTAVATDNLGVSTTSGAITIGVNTPASQPGEFIWFDDDLPQGATKHVVGDGDWYWVTANPGAFSGTRAHQSRNFGQLDAPNTSFHEHSFDGATATLPIGAGDKLFTYVFLDINNMPREIMLHWKDATGWEHRAYWGANRINSGTDGTNSRRYMGPIPKPGQWVRLEVPATYVGLVGSTVNGMAFSLDAGRATWDLAGKATANVIPRPTTTPGDSVWIEDDLPPGAVTATVNDQWNWVASPRFSGQKAHQSQVSASHNQVTFRSHSFTGAQTPMQVNPGDILFTWVLLDPSAKPDQIMLQWYDGTGWEHRAFWGENFINHLVGGVHGTESQRYMGGVPKAGEWSRLEVPASYVGLEGKAVTGMAFSLYGKEPTVTWDRSGKAAQSTNVFLPLSATAAVWSLKSKNDYAYDTNTQGVPNHAAEGIAFYAHANQAAGTVPYYRFHDFKGKFYYSTCRDCAEQSGWIRDGVAFYVYPDASTPGTVPLYEFHGSESFFYSVNPNAPAGMTANGISAYVYPSPGLVPTAPSNVIVGFRGHGVDWQDNSPNETAFRIEREDAGWVEIAAVGANITRYEPNVFVAPCEYISYRVRAVNELGASAPAEGSYGCDYIGNPPDNPGLEVPSPASGESLQRSVAIAASGFDPNTASTITKVEFFANSTKIGESLTAPYLYGWNDVPPGTYNITAIARGAGGSSAPSPRVVVDAPPSVNIVSPAASQVVDRNFAITANAFDADGNGSIAKVEFFADGNKLGEVADPQYIFGWSNAPSGSHSLTVKVTDNAGASTISSPVSVTVDAAPSVSIDSPANGAVLNSPITISASASDSDGSVSKVEFFQGSTKLGEDTTAPYGFDWNNVAAGSYVLTAVATDNLGRATVSSPVSITVNAPPTVSIIMPASGTVFTAPTDLTINANGSDTDGTISKVEFYQGTTLLGTDLTSPYSYTWSNVSAGNYSITAKATDNLGAMTSSIPISITVNALPNVSISSPTSGTSFAAPGTVSINAVASDDGSISKVEFFKGATLIGTVTASPYNFTWNSVPAGSYSLTARATDNLGAAVTSSAVSITVVINPPRDWYWKFDEGSGMVVADSNGSSNQGTLINGTNWTIGKSGSALGFDGADDIVALSTNGLTDINNNFTLSFWALPSASHEIDPESTGGYGGVSGQRYAFGPGWYDSGHAGAGVSVGTNGISVYEHAANYMPATLVYPTAITNWTHIAVVYENKQPKLYINGVLVRTGQTSPMNYVHVTPYYIGGMAYGHFAGVLDEVRIYNRSLSAIEVSNVYNASNNLTLGKIVFASNRDGSAQIYSMNQEGSSLFRLTSDAANNECPRWSPNNSRIVFQSDRDNLFSGAADIYVMNWDGSGQTRLTSDAADDSAPAWSPDGTKIAFQSARNGVNYQVYVMNADGSGQVNVSNSTANDTQPSWSPDGTKIAFASDRDQPGFSSIYVMNANGSGQTRLTSSGPGFRDEQPAWSPNGMKLMFTSTRDSIVETWQETDDDGGILVRTATRSNKEVYVMNADGSTVLRLTTTLENDDSPAWSGDGTKIVFRSERERDCCDPTAQIWIMNADGSNQLDFSNNGLGDYCPSWSH